MARKTPPVYPAASWKLTGPLEGKTFAAGEFLFRDGVFTTTQFSPRDLVHMDRHFEQWQAVRILEGASNGQRDFSQVRQGPDGYVLTDGSRAPAYLKADEGAGVGETPSGESSGRGMAPEGNGSASLVVETTGDPIRNRLVAAVRSLDPNVDTNWTQSGKPALDAVERALGYSGVKRAELEAACPGFVRVQKPDISTQEA